MKRFRNHFRTAEHTFPVLMVTTVLDQSANQNNRKNRFFLKKGDPTGLQTIKSQRIRNQNGFILLRPVGGRRQWRNNNLKRNIFKQASYQLRLPEKPLQTCIVPELTCMHAFPLQIHVLHLTILYLASLTWHTMSQKSLIYSIYFWSFMSLTKFWPKWVFRCSRYTKPSDFSLLSVYCYL